MIGIASQDERLRRSRTDWRQLLPEDEWPAQEAYERQQTIVRMHSVGMKPKQIREYLGVSKNVVAHYIARSRYEQYQKSPLERYLRTWGSGEIAALYEAGKYESFKVLEYMSEQKPAPVRDWLVV